MIQIHYGFGKGKTSNLNGSAIRAIGANMSVSVFRFLKGRSTSENFVMEQLGINVSMVHYGDKFSIEMSEEELKELKKCVDLGLKKILEVESDVILLDEIIDLVKVNMITEDELINIIQKISKKHKEVILTGHYKLEKLFDLADLITHYEAEKHYFDKGVVARKGIEF